MWKYIVDVKYHHLGPNVFDEGLHGVAPEPGFLNSALEAFNYIKDKPLTIETYRMVNKIAGSHFNEKMPHFIIDSKQAGSFRDGVEVNARFFPTEIFDRFITIEPFVSPFLDFDGYNVHFDGILIYQLNQIDINHNHNIKIFVNLITTLYNLLATGKIDYINGKYYYNRRPLEIVYSCEYIFEVFQFMIINKENYITAIIDERVNLLNDVTNLCSFHNENNMIVIKYNILDPEIYLEEIINHFNKTEKIDKKEIFLYQRLEWLHPFYDGQGRTDIIILQKLLKDHGYPMVEMYDPYLSTYLTVDELLEIY